jgi:hypothetical protein
MPKQDTKPVEEPKDSKNSFSRCHHRLEFLFERSRSYGNNRMQRKSRVVELSRTGFWSNFTIPHSTLYGEPRGSIFIHELEELFFLRRKHLDTKREY